MAAHATHRSGPREVATDDERLQRLLDEERVALREPVREMQKLVAERVARAEDRLQHRRRRHRGRVARQAALDTRRARSRSATSRDSLRPGLLAAIGQRDDDRL